MKSLVIFVLLTMITYQTAALDEVDPNTILKIATEVKNHYRLHCIILFLKDDQGMEMNLKYLRAETGAAISTLHIGKLSDSMETLLCGNKMPLFVFPHVHQQMYESLAKLSENTLTLGMWLVFVPTGISLENLFADVYIPLESEFLVAQNSSQVKAEVALTEVYHIHRSLPLQTYRVANWSSSDGTDWCTIPYHLRRGDLQGIIMKASIVPFFHLIEVRKNKNQKPIRVSGYSVDIWEELARRLNFSTEYMMSKDLSYGARDKNGTWSGMTGMIIRKEVDVAMLPLWYTTARLDVVGYLPPFWNSRYYIYIRRPTMEHLSVTAAYSSFSFELWAVVMISIFLLFIFLSISWDVSHRGRKYVIHKMPSFKLYDSWLVVFGSFCQQGHDTAPQNLSSRLIYFTSYCVALVMFIAYAGTVISFITVRKFEIPFRDFKDLADDGTYRIAVVNASANLKYFEESTDSTLSAVYTRLIHPIKDSLPKHDEEGLSQVCNMNKYGYMSAKMIVGTIYKKLSCDIINVPEAYLTRTLSMLIGKNNPYRRLLNFNFQELRRNGVLKRIRNKYFPSIPQEIIQEPPKSVSLQSVISFFLILAVGILISIAFFILEINSQRFASYLLWFNRN